MMVSDTMNSDKYDDDIKLIDLIDTTVRGLNLAYRLLNQTHYTTFLPQDILSSSSMYWLRYYQDNYASVVEIYSSFTDYGITSNDLKWHNLEIEYQKYSDYEDLNENKYLDDNGYFDGNQALTDYVNDHSEI